MTTVSTHEARRNFSELLELAFYKNEQIRISRNKKPMARLVGEPFMQTVEKLIDYIIEQHPTLADTLAIELDEEIQAIIERGREEYKAGKAMPIESILEDE
ncbi:MAG: type II toxin-antitoxin system Phd/YefM family antitoxin [Anaerolineae bacterium]|nr:type II toxin-antitoxin system Phd/YefM family antitoxin [Anaerolineae bacterium]